MGSGVKGVGFVDLGLKGVLSLRFMGSGSGASDSCFAVGGSGLVEVSDSG